MRDQECMLFWLLYPVTYFRHVGGSDVAEGMALGILEEVGSLVGNE